MAMTEIVRVPDGRWGTDSWTDGFRPTPAYQLTLKEEARRNPEAVFNRLVLQGDWDTIEELGGSLFP